MEHSVIIRDLVKTYGSLEVLKNVGFSVKSGEIFGLLGPNGAGKSTLIHTLSGLIKPTSGGMFIEGYDASKKGPEIKKIIGVALQKNSFYEGLSVKENIMYFGSLYDIDNETLEERIDRLLEMFSLSQKKDVAAGKLSGGMRRKLNIICSLIHNPEILILDEPTAGLDPMSKRDLWNIIKKINKNDTTIIITSHLMEDIEALCDRVAIMVSGRIVAEGTLQELKRFIKMSILRVVVDPYKVDEACEALKTNDVDFEVFDNIIMIRTPNVRKTYSFVQVFIGQHIQTAEKIPPSIEDVFLYFTGGVQKE